MGHADLHLHTVARERWVDRRADEIANHLINAGSMGVVPMWGVPDENGRKVPVLIDFIGWVHQERGGDADIGICINGGSSRRVRLFCDYAEERAQRECDALPADYFSEVA